MKYPSLLVLLAFLSAAANATDAKDIYSPTPDQSAALSNPTGTVRHGSWGMGLNYLSQENLAAHMGISMNVRWFAGERWYVLGEYQYAPFNGDVTATSGSSTLEANENAHVIAAGAGYALMQGSASINGRQALPWQLAVEGLAGQQLTGDTSGRYTGLGLSWQIIGREYWVASGWRLYTSDDSRLKDFNVQSGAQWGISFGSWF